MLYSSALFRCREKSTPEMSANALVVRSMERSGVWVCGKLCGRASGPVVQPGTGGLDDAFGRRGVISISDNRENGGKAA